MTVAIYRSTQPSAPAFTNTAGSFLSVLDFCLVTGQSWTKTTLATNQASYTQPGGSNGFVLQVDDTGTTVARALAWETLSAFNTGTNQVPSTAHMTSAGFTTNAGFYVDKALGSYTSGGAPWRLLTNGSIFYFFSQYDSASLDRYTALAFGDLLSYKPSDAYGTVISGHGTASNNHKIFATSYVTTESSPSGGSGSVLAYLMRPVHGLSGFPSGDIQCSWTTDVVRTNSSTISAEGTQAAVPFPSVVDGALWLAPCRVAEPLPSGVTNTDSLGMRGLVPGIWFIVTVGHLFPDGYQFTCGSGPLAGRTMEIVGAQGGTTTFGQIAIEVSNTWGGGF